MICVDPEGPSFHEMAEVLELITSAEGLLSPSSVVRGGSVWYNHPELTQNSEVRSLRNTDLLDPPASPKLLNRGGRS